MTHAIYGTHSVHMADVMEALATARVGVQYAEREAAAAMERRSITESLGGGAKDNDDEDAPPDDVRAQCAAELAAATLETKMADGFEEVDTGVLEMEPLQMCALRAVTCRYTGVFEI